VWTDGARQMATLMLQQLSIRKQIGWQSRLWRARLFDDDAFTPLSIWHSEPVLFGGIQAGFDEATGRERAVRLEQTRADGLGRAHLHYQPFVPDAWNVGGSFLNTSGRAAWLSILPTLAQWTVYAEPEHRRSWASQWDLTTSLATLNSRRSRIPVAGDPLVEL